MKYALIFTLLAAAATQSLAAPFDLNDLFTGLSVEQQPEQDVVKRQVHANSDGALKQISFQTLIGDLENSLFQSALSLNGASGPDTQLEEVHPEQPAHVESNAHSLSKRSDEHAATTEAALPEDAQERKILLQTTKKVPLSEETGPAHLIIDRVSVQPHNGASVPLIPIFQVHHTKITSATIKEDANNDSSDGKQTKISITKTSITSTAPVESLETQSSSNNADVVTTERATSSSSPREESSTASSTTSSSTISSSTTSPSTTPTTTTEQPKLEEKEKKLKEKVAEVEAEPVILSARV